MISSYVAQLQGVKMDIHLKRSFVIDASIEKISHRLKQWSHKYGLTCTCDTPGNWEYHRGTHLQASFTFDVRKVPTTVTVTMTEGPPANVNCSIHVKSWLNFETPGDKKRVEEQIELLMAYIKGIYEE